MRRVRVMSTAEMVKSLNDICSAADEICDVAKTAKRNNKSLKSSNFYADKFHTEATRLGGLEASTKSHLLTLGLDPALIAQLSEIIGSVRSPEISFAERLQR